MHHPNSSTRGRCRCSWNRCWTSPSSLSRTDKIGEHGSYRRCSPLRHSSSWRSHSVRLYFSRNVLRLMTFDSWTGRQISTSSREATRRTPRQSLTPHTLHPSTTRCHPGVRHSSRPRRRRRRKSRDWNEGIDSQLDGRTGVYRDRATDTTRAGGAASRRNRRRWRGRRESQEYHRLVLSEGRTVGCRLEDQVNSRPLFILPDPLPLMVSEFRERMLILRFLLQIERALGVTRRERIREVDATLDGNGRSSALVYARRRVDGSSARWTSYCDSYVVAVESRCDHLLTTNNSTRRHRAFVSRNLQFVST